ncbi:hypothetical protein F4859DRAFT_457714 [Xylaria cf. heliscus]|nr:hypothetical protein F4859DRAFT_457714 [Xylaria cf. heliscus]
MMATGCPMSLSVILALMSKIIPLTISSSVGVGRRQAKPANRSTPHRLSNDMLHLLTWGERLCSQLNPQRSISTI